MDLRKTIYTLGEICAAIWPPGTTHSIPHNILNNYICNRPASLLAEMVKHRSNTAAKQEAVAELVDKLSPDICDPPGGVKNEDQVVFWSGYYHYAAARDAAHKYGPAELEQAGKVLFGDRWQTDLANALQLSDARRIRQWMAKERPIPVGVWADVCGLLRHRQMSISQVLQDFVSAPE